MCNKGLEHGLVLEGLPFVSCGKLKNQKSGVLSTLQVSLCLNRLSLTSMVVVDFKSLGCHLDFLWNFYSLVVKNIYI